MNIITVNNLGKRYRVGTRERERTLVGSVLASLAYPVKNWRELVSRRRFKEGEDDPTVMWALRDVSFTVKEGEVLGIIGHNGAGKSSLLKILSRITEPSTGSAKLRGRVSSLLEVGTGFHNDLTGRDNVFMNGTILGMTRREVAQKFDEIVAFSGVEKHIDTPVKYYSSGMKVRLAFAVAAHLEPEILIIDEVLAVGDLAFQEKCLGKMNSVAQSGRTVLFVSHNMVAVEGLCDRCLLLQQGRLQYDGSVATAIDHYRQASLARATGVNLADRTDRGRGTRVRFTKVQFNEGRPVGTGEPLVIDVAFVSAEATDAFQIAVKISRSYRDTVLTISSNTMGTPLAVTEGTNHLRITLPRLDIMPGNYLVDLWAGISHVTQDRLHDAARLTVGERDVYGTGFMLEPGKNGIVVPRRCTYELAPAGVPYSSD